MANDTDVRPFLLGGLLFALLLLALATRDISPTANAALEAQFRPRETGAAQLPLPALPALPDLRLPALPADLQQVAAEIQRRLALGEASAPLTPAADGPRVRVEVTSIQRDGDRIRISGSLTARTTPVTLPANAFIFRDSAGVSYTADAGAGTTLAPGAPVAFDLGVPLPASRGLVLNVVLPPDAPLTLTLLAASE